MRIDGSQHVLRHGLMDAVLSKAGTEQASLDGRAGG